MPTSSKTRILAAVVAAFAAAPTLAPAQQQPSGNAVVATAKSPGKGAAAGVVTQTATVEAIDAATRTVTLKTPDGRSTQVVAGPEVRNFAQIAVGDRVITRVVEAVSLELKKGGGALRTRTEQDMADRTKAGDKPGAMVGRKVTVVADVLAVNERAQTVTLRGPEQTVDLRVPDPKQLKLVKVGDQVEATFTQAVAVSVEPAPPAAKK
jgi:Cu/Ag efflux protein CusF